jgi:hypothetical protein
MKTVTLHQDVEGHKANDEIEVDDDRAAWLVAQGYASIKGDDSDKTRITDVPADKDPTLAKNHRDSADFAAVGLDAPQDRVARGEEVEAHEVFANMTKDEETGESVNVETQAPTQRLGNTEAERSQAQADMAAAGRRAGDEGQAQADAPTSKTQGATAQKASTKDAGK